MFDWWTERDLQTYRMGRCVNYHILISTRNGTQCNVQILFRLNLVQIQSRLHMHHTFRKTMATFCSMMGPSTHGILDSTNFAMTAVELCIRGDDRYLQYTHALCIHWLSIRTFHACTSINSYILPIKIKLSMLDAWWMQ